MKNQNQYPEASSLFVWLFVFFSVLEVTGGYIDGWAHTHLARIDTFFTPYHALFYSAFVAIEVLVLNQAINNHRAGYPWKRCLPKQYLFALAGIVLFNFADGSDLIWHLFFGIEKGVDALLSPTHMLLSFSGAMIASAPLHAIWYKGSKTQLQKFPVTLAFACVFGTITFMTQYLHPFGYPWMANFQQGLIANTDYARVLGIANVVAFTTIFMGLVLSTIKHWKFAPGSFTIILVLNIAAITLMRGDNYIFIATAVVAGILIDVIYQEMKKNLLKHMHLRLFGFLVPVVLFSCYVATILAWQGTWWSIHFVTGSILISGLVGVLLTYILLPPESVES